MSARHRVLHYCLYDGMQDLLSLSVTDGQKGVRHARWHADVFHSYEFTARDGTALHLVYALFQADGESYFAGRVKDDVMYLYEMTSEAVAAYFGLAPRRPRRSK